MVHSQVDMEEGTLESENIHSKHLTFQFGTKRSSAFFECDHHVPRVPKVFRTQLLYILFHSQLTVAQLSANNRRRKDLYKLPKADQDLFVALGYREKLNLVDEAILKNAEFLEGIVSGPGIFDGEDDDEDAPEDDVEMNHERTSLIVPIVPAVNPMHRCVQR